MWICQNGNELKHCGKGCLDSTIDHRCQYLHAIQGSCHCKLSWGTSCKKGDAAFDADTYFPIQAILGGYCVDTVENLGAPLTSIVDTFFGVAVSLICRLFLHLSSPRERLKDR